MSDYYEPTTDDVRQAYAIGNREIDDESNFNESREEFDRWLNAKLAKVWDEGFDEGHYTPTERANGQTQCDCRHNPYRPEATP